MIRDRSKFVGALRQKNGRFKRIEDILVASLLRRAESIRSSQTSPRPALRYLMLAHQVHSRTQFY